MSGRFRNVVPGEVGGLWEAFLVGGAGSIVATLHEVDPRAARDVAVGFHSRWPDKGRTRGAALREAQLAVRAERPATRDWAAHVLIGDAY
jgi:CHAT domain-containing protein